MNALMLLALAALSGLLYTQWQHWPPPAPKAPQTTGQPGQAPANRSEAPGAGSLFGPDEEKSAFASVGERPLFLPDRRPPKEEPSPVDGTPTSDEESDPTGWQVTSIFITPEMTRAYLRAAGEDKSVDVEVNAQVDGWTVKSIEKDRVVVERQGKTNTLVLFDYETPDPNARPPTPAARRPQPSRPGASPNARTRRADIDARRQRLRERREAYQDRRRPGARPSRARPNASTPPRMDTP